MTHPEDPTCQCGHPASQHALSIEANCRGADEDGCACRLYSEQVYAAEIARLQSVGQDYAAALNRKNAEVFRLHGERDALARDAARWREVVCELAAWGTSCAGECGSEEEHYRKVVGDMIRHALFARKRLDAARSAAPSTTGEHDA